MADYYAFNKHPLESEPALRIYNRDGTLRFSKSLADLFGPNAKYEFHIGDGYIVWLSDVWINAKNNQIVIVSSARPGNKDSNGQVIVIDLATAKMHLGGASEIGQALENNDPLTVASALDISSEITLPNPATLYRKVHERNDVPIRARVQAAILLARQGDGGGCGLLLRTALQPTKEQLDPDSLLFDDDLARGSRDAILALPDVFGAESLCTLRNAVQRYGDSWYIRSAFVRLGKTALPMLTEMLQDTSDLECQVLAVEAIVEAKLFDVEMASQLEMALDRVKFSSNPDDLERNLAWGLGHCGASAIAAVPKLMNLAKGSKDSIHQLAISGVESIIASWIGTHPLLAIPVF